MCRYRAFSLLGMNQERADPEFSLSLLALSSSSSFSDRILSRSLELSPLDCGRVREKIFIKSQTNVILFIYLSLPPGSICQSCHIVSLRRLLSGHGGGGRRLLLLIFSKSPQISSFLAASK